MRKLIKERRAYPKDDLVTAPVQAKDGNDQLSEDEVLAMIFLLLVAGHKTTVNLIGSGSLALLEHSDQLAKLRLCPYAPKTVLLNANWYQRLCEKASQAARASLVCSEAV